MDLMVAKESRLLRRLLPWGTRRWYHVQIARIGISILRNEGLRSFWLLARPWISSRLPFPIGDRYAIWIENNDPRMEELAFQKAQSDRFPYRPKITIITPMCNTDHKWLKLAIDSVLAQTYDDWEFCIVDGGSTEPHAKGILEDYSRQDPRVKARFLTKNRSMVDNSNEALSVATGEFVVLLDQDDELAPNALFECVHLLNQQPDTDFIYSDEDRIDNKGKRFSPFFKPDWSPDYFLSFMYTGRLGMYRKSIVDRIGGFRESCDGAQDYDFVLRYIEHTTNIRHIHKVLYHSRSLLQSTAAGLESNPRSHPAGKQALVDSLIRNGIKAEVLDGPQPGFYRVKREILGRPLVSIIIPNKDNVNILRRCVDSILLKTEYEHYEVLIVDNQSTEPVTLEYYDKIRAEPRIRILRYDRAFNYSALNNWAVGQAGGEHILLLNNDTEVISPEWVTAMLEHSQRAAVGVVGAKLLFPDGTIQHCGVILGLGADRVAVHALTRSLEGSDFFKRASVINNYSAFTAACMMFRKRVFEEIDGFDESFLYSYNDIDLCLKIREKGYVNVYTPYATLYHLESYSRGYQDTFRKRQLFVEEAEYLRSKWVNILNESDPYYNPNLSLYNIDFHTIK